MILWMYVLFCVYPLYYVSYIINNECKTDAKTHWYGKSGCMDFEDFGKFILTVYISELLHFLSHHFTLTENWFPKDSLHWVCYGRLVPFCEVYMPSLVSSFNTSWIAVIIILIGNMFCLMVTAGVVVETRSKTPDLQRLIDNFKHSLYCPPTSRIFASSSVCLMVIVPAQYRDHSRVRFSRDVPAVSHDKLTN